MGQNVETEDAETDRDTEIKSDGPVRQRQSRRMRWSSEPKQMDSIPELREAEPRGYCIKKPFTCEAAWCPLTPCPQCPLRQDPSPQ